MGLEDLMEEKTIRRNLRSASMTRDLPRLGPKHSLESVKKTHQVARVGGWGYPPGVSASNLAFEPDPDMSLPMAQGMKRLGMPIAALFGVVLIGLIAMSWFLNRDALRQAVEAQIRAVTGLELVVGGSIDVSVFPASYVSFHDV